MSEPFKHALQHPVTVTYSTASGEERSETITELSLRSEMIAEDLLAIDEHEGDNAKSIAMIARLSGRTFAEIKKLRLPDYRVLTRAIDSFT